MAKKDLSDFNSDSEPEEDDCSEKSIEDEDEEEEEEKPSNMAKQVIPDYEKQRQSRMAQNRARMKALGLHTMAASLMAASPQKSSHSRISDKRKGKRKLVDEDDDYKPNDDATAEDQDDDDEDEDEDEDEDDDEFSCSSTAKSRRKKPQNKSTKPKNKLPLKKHSRGKDYINEEEEDDDDDELMKAISLSLQDLPEKENANSRDGAGRKKKPQFNSRAKMTEDELILHFFQFDESGKGFLTVRDLERVSAAHDFTWTDGELADMIRCFDSDGDGKLNLDDFRKIAGRCNMI